MSITLAVPWKTGGSRFEKKCGLLPSGCFPPGRIPRIPFRHPLPDALCHSSVARSWALIRSPLQILLTICGRLVLLEMLFSLVFSCPARMDCSAECLHQVACRSAPAAELFSQLPIFLFPAGFFLHQPLNTIFTYPGKNIFVNPSLFGIVRCADAGNMDCYSSSTCPISGEAVWRWAVFPGYRSPLLSLFFRVGRPRALILSFPGFLLRFANIDSRLPDPLAYAARGS